MNATMERVAELKAAGEDEEFYPSTDEIIQSVADDIRWLRENRYEGYYDRDSGDLMDIGAGDGRVLLKLKEHFSGDREFQCIEDLYAIEKSKVHIGKTPKEVVVIGTDFMQQSLVDKPMRFVFCNPPYSRYVEWVTKIIRECSAVYVYLVIPKRWRDVQEIQEVIKDRDAEVESVGEFDFEDADRQARAKVEVLRVQFGRKSKDAFDSVIEDMLPELKAFDRDKDLEGDESDDPRACEVADGSESLIDSLVIAYEKEVAHLIETYRMAAKVKPEVLEELGVTKSTILKGIRSKITGLKDKYWKALFDHLGDVTKRLATKQRKAFLDSLNGKAKIDFTQENIFSMLIWISKWCSDFYDEQLVDLFHSLTEKCNVVNYKSNQKTWEKSGWRYNSQLDNHTHFKLEYRLVVEHTGGICTSEYTYRKEEYRGLEERAFGMINDIVTVANNLGFACEDHPSNYQWEAGKKRTLVLNSGEPLVEIRAYKNGNIHARFNQKVILAINVEAGRLLGWLKSPDDAVDELQVKGKEAEAVRQAFKTSYRIDSKNAGLLVDARGTAA
jgi:hypothetical protein